MDVTVPQIMFGKVMHKRLFERVNQFTYGIYYLALPLSSLKNPIENFYFKYNRLGLLSFFDKDHGNRDGQDLEKWARDILSTHKLDKADGEIVLVCMPRVFGYVFNPVSFWYCYGRDEKLRAVICEVNNTFGETHSYVCAHDDQAEIQKDDILSGQKIFHVSPFLEREGSYKFRFTLPDDKMGVWIDFFDAQGEKKLLTALNGKFSPLSQSVCARAFWAYPLVTIKAITLIHWQAMKLFFNRIVYVPKPVQLETKITRVKTLKENL